MSELEFEVLVDLLREAENVVVMTGAGVSAESGIPTFRDALEGYWSKYNAEELATPQAFARNPELVTRWYDSRRLKVLACSPNAGHHALSRMEAELEASGRSFTLLTQNVDGLHVRAGSKNVVEVHGSLIRWRSVDTGETTLDLPEGAFESYPPRASDGGLLRPDVVWFGEPLPIDALTAAGAALRESDLYIAIGTSGVVFPAAGFVLDAKRAGAKAVEVNLTATPMTDKFDMDLRGKSGVLLPLLVDAAFGPPEEA